MNGWGDVFRTLDELKRGDLYVLKSEKKIDAAPLHSYSGWHLISLNCGSLADLPSAPHLTSLYITDCSKLRSLHGIERLNSLESLFIFDCNRLTDLRGIERLQRLKHLTICSSFSSNMTIDTLEPISGSASLETLLFYGKTRDGCLEPIFRLSELKQVYVSNAYRWDEFARLEAYQPRVNFPWKGGVVYDANPSILNCSHCKNNLAMLTGKGLKLCCPVCDQQRIEGHLSRYLKIANGAI